MALRRRDFLKAGVTAAAGLAMGRPARSATPRRTVVLDGRRAGSVFNNDEENILLFCPGAQTTPDDYLRFAYALLDLQPGILAQSVGMPDPVCYPSDVATAWDKYYDETIKAGWPWLPPEQHYHVPAVVQALRAAGTDPLTLTIEAGRRRGVPVVAAYRMNSEDYYGGTRLYSDFSRDHPEWMIPDRPVLDYAVPQVRAQRLAIFREVAERFDIDGLEFDFRRWYYMVSDPLKNHTALTRLVRETREMLDATARRKGRGRMILGVRVGPSLDRQPNPYIFPGVFYDLKPTNASCRELGLDVRTWVREGLVDYVCPGLFLSTLPGLPLTREFAELAQGTNTGIYPTLFPPAAWMHGICERTVGLEPKDMRALALFKHDLCTTVLKAYADGADGISTFNWFVHLRNGLGQFAVANGGNAGAEAVQTYIYPLLGDPQAVRRYLAQPWALPPQISAQHGGAGQWRPGEGGPY